MSLLEKKCVPCEGDTTPLAGSELQEYLNEVSDWQLIDGASIFKNFKFANFAESLAFVNKIGAIAESEGHHPDIEFGWGYAKVKLMTHKINGLSINDFILAAKINNLGM